MVLEGGVWDGGADWDDGAVCDGGACDEVAVCDVRTDAPSSNNDPAKQIALIFPKESLIAMSPEKA
ncbi:MAG TPA: hypothetical protein VJS43_13720, partial [Candidatus Acidoferrales bacterium]|nr:hypothetical protein [Candidatus Acidoferrales bacterium]